MSRLVSRGYPFVCRRFSACVQPVVALGVGADVRCRLPCVPTTRASADNTSTSVSCVRHCHRNELRLACIHASTCTCGVGSRFAWCHTTRICGAHGDSDCAWPVFTASVGPAVGPPARPRMCPCTSRRVPWGVHSCCWPLHARKKFGRATGKPAYATRDSNSKLALHPLLPCCASLALTLFLRGAGSARPGLSVD